MLIAQCMRQHSFDYVPPKPPFPVDSEATTGDYELLASQTASVQGYGIVDNALTNKADETIGASPQPQASRPGFKAALTGTAKHQVTLDLIGGSTVFFDSDGCVTEAIDELYGTQWNQVSFDLEGLASSVVQSVVTSPAWTSALGTWSDCMSNQYNVHFATPNAARAAVDGSVTTAVTGVSTATAETRLHAMRPGEVTLAVRDATCQQKVDLASVAQQAQNKAQSSDEKQYSAPLSTYASELAHADKMADSILG